MKLRGRWLSYFAVGIGWLLFCRPGVAQAATQEPRLSPPLHAAALDAAGIEDLLRQAHDLEGNDTALALQKTREALAGTKGRADLRSLDLQGQLQLGRLLRLLNDYPSALKVAEDGMTLARNLGDLHVLGELFLVRGFAEWNQAKVPEATVSMMEAFRLSEALNDNPLRVGALYGRGLVRGRVDDLDEALANLEAARQLAAATDDARLGLVLNSLGNLYLQRKDYPRARQALEEALGALQGGSNQRTFAYALLNLGQAATETGDQETAGRYLDESAAICERFQFRRGIADIAYLRGARARRLGDLDEATRQLDKARSLAETLGNPDLFVTVYEEYVQIEQARGNFRGALEYNRRLAEKLEVVRGERSRRQASEIEARYESEHHARQIEQLQRAHDVQQADLAIKEAELGTVRWTLASLVLGGIALGALVSRRSAHARLTRKLLAETRAAKSIVEIADARKAELLTLARHDLDESEARFRSAFEYSALGFALVGLDGRWLRVNQALCKIVGYTETELLARDFQSITHPADLAANLARAAKVIAREADHYTMEKRYLHKEGHSVWARIDVAVMLDPASGQPSYFISQIQDITEERRSRELLHKAKEEAEGANAAKNAFLSRMSHELRTPLNAILGFGQLLETEDLGERHNQSVGHITGAGRHLLKLIDEALDIAQIENGQFSFQPEAVLATEILSNVVNFMQPAAREAKIDLRMAASEDHFAPAYIHADPRRLRQILLNLLANAIKYNRTGGEVVAYCLTRDGRVCLDVRDTGVGIAQTDAERVFAPFTRLPRTERVPGAGLGLSVSRSLAEVMGGTLTLASLVDVGSTFTVEFARLSAAEAEQDVEPALEGLPAEFFEAEPPKRTVLYIEDHEDNRELVRRILAPMEGVQFFSAADGETGIKTAHAEKPDLILLDLRLHDMSGVEVLRRLRADPATAHMRVVVMSADASMRHLDELRALGVSEYLTNPFDLREFRRLVENYLSLGSAANVL